MDQLSRRIATLESGAGTQKVLQSAQATGVGAGVVEVKTTDGSFDSIESGLEFDQADGFSLSQSGANAKVNFTPPPKITALQVQSAVQGGDTIANTTTETAFASLSYTLPANSLAVGDVLRVKLWGIYGTDAIAPTIRAKLKAGSTVLLDTAAITAVINVANLGWWAEGYVTVQAIGASGSLEAQGYAEFATAATTGLSVNMSNTAAKTVDTTATQAITVTVQWGTASANNTITMREMVLEKVRV